MTTLATCDPGNDAGLSLFRDGVLVWCGLNEVPPSHTVDAWLGHNGRVDRLVIEIPNANEKRAKAKKQDLIRLAITAGRWQERVPHVKLTERFPSEWKGSVPKEMHNGLVLQALTLTERQVFAACCAKIPQGKRNNVVDAIGLGLEDLGRIGRGGRPI